MMTPLTRLALWIHERSLAAEERDPIVGDLLEELEARSARDPRLAARWLWAQTCRSLVPNLHRRWLAFHSRPAEQPAGGGRMLNGFATDLRFAARLMARQPLMSAVAFVSLSAALGLNILLLTLADAALFRPLPLRSPNDLVLLMLQRDSGLMHNFPYTDYVDLRERARTVDGLVAYGSVDATLAGPDGASPIEGEVVSGNFFSTLGAPLRAGRAIVDADDRSGSPPAAVISEQLWRDQLGSAPLSGQVVQLNGQAFTVVGVAAARFAGMQVGRRAAFWVPLAHSPILSGGNLLTRPTTSWLTVIGRLRDRASIEPTRQELDAILRDVRARSGRSVEPVVLRPGARGDSQLSEQLSSPMRLLLAAGVIVLLVACLNVANLQLARTEARRLELAVRAALGARRAQIVRLVLLDGLLMAMAAGAAGVWAAVLTKDRAVSMIAFYGQPVSLAIPFDLRVISAAVVLSFMAASIIGLMSIWHIVRPHPGGGLSDARAATASRVTSQRVSVVLQVALSMALVTGAALMVRTLDRLRDADLGFDPRGVAVVRVSPEMGRLSRNQAVAYFDEAIARVAALPGVEGAAVAHVMPLDFGGSRMTVGIAGYKPAADEDLELNFIRVSGGYFGTLGLPVVQGRNFDDRDRADQPERIVVNETMARRFWPDGQAVGKFVRFDSRNPYNVEVIGVVRDVHYRMVREDPRPSFYVSFTQFPSTAGVLHVRYRRDGTAANDRSASRIEELRRTVAGVNPSVPVTRAHTLLEQVERNIADERMAMAIGLTLALVALVLATAGLYATMAFLVGRRTREIGVRMALGARTADVRALVVREGAALALAGIVLGLALAAWVGHALRHQLFEIGGTDPVSLAVAAGVLGSAAIVASWLPARRAARVDPVVALRES